MPTGTATGPRADGHRGSNHDYYHGLDPPTNNVPRRRGGSPVRMSNSRAMERRRVSRSRSQSPRRRREDLGREPWQEADTYRPQRPSFDSLPQASPRRGERSPRRDERS